mmetsp:Transcript_48855/g.110945  ORF Transcript_48855/g.110945 Transcript_48855/m.110945 type:complete len:101 (-) Transcript_48855:32-334(-)
MVWGLLVPVFATRFEPACRATAVSIAAAGGKTAQALAPLVAARLIGHGAAGLWFFATGWAAAGLGALGIGAAGPCARGLARVLDRWAVQQRRGEGQCSEA